MEARGNLADLRRAAEREPDSIPLWVALCEEAERQKDYAEVLRAGDILARLAPTRPQPHYIRGLALHYLERPEEAADAYRAAVTRDPMHADAWGNLGFVCQSLNLTDEAEAACRRAITASGQDIAGGDDALFAQETLGSRHWNLAVIELLKGDLRNGFARYSACFSSTEGRARPAVAQPLWRGENLGGKTILITVDQGHGDTLLLARFLPYLRRQNARVILRAQPALVAYLKNWDGVDDVIAHGEALPAFDFHANEFDVPRYLGTTLATLPAQTPYLPLPAPDAATRLTPAKKFRVGLCWAGNPAHVNDGRRSLALSDLLPLFGIDAEFFAFTRDKKEGDEALIAQLPLTDLAPRLDDFAATARLLGQMDLVISCDTSVAHLAGGMGRKLWVMLPFAPSWCWMMGREDSPWYPTARLFRQKTPGDWRGVIEGIAAALSLSSKAV